MTKSVQIPKEIWRDLKIKSVEEEKPMSEIASEAIKNYLELEK